MNDQIVCPNCKKAIPLTQALSHQLQEKYREFYKKRLGEEVAKKEQELRGELSQKIKQEMELQIKDKGNENEELHRQNKVLQEQLLELNRMIRGLKNENELKRIELERKLAQEQEKIRMEEKRRSEEEYKLKLLEKDKQMVDMRKQIEELKRRSEQGSQQLQGEVLELELASILKKEFPYDEIQEVPKGVTGGDVLHIVKNNFGKECGKIIWEFKRTKSWTDMWITKLREDQRKIKADIAIIISQILPDGVKYITQKNGVWIGNFESIISLALLLRSTLVKLSEVRSAVVGKQEKKEILWTYLTSIEFKQRLDAMYDAYQQTKIQLDKEKEFFRRKWAREEKSIQLLMDNLMGIHGDLQAIIGRSLPEMKDLGALTSGKEEEKTLF